MAEIMQCHEKILREWIDKSPPDLTFPPPCFVHMGGELLEWSQRGKKLVARFPTKAEFQNPRQYMQGGFVVAALDNTLGPLSYLCGAPSVTTQLNTCYIRPVAAHYAYIDVVARVLDKTNTKLFSSAEAYSPKGKLLTTVQATSHIVL